MERPSPYPTRLAGALTVSPPVMSYSWFLLIRNLPKYEPWNDSMADGVTLRQRFAAWTFERDPDALIAAHLALEVARSVVTLTNGAPPRNSK